LLKQQSLNTVNILPTKKNKLSFPFPFAAITNGSLPFPFSVCSNKRQSPFSVVPFFLADLQKRRNKLLAHKIIINLACFSKTSFFIKLRGFHSLLMMRINYSERKTQFRDHLTHFTQIISPIKAEELITLDRRALFFYRLLTFMKKLKRETENGAQAISLNPVTVCSSCRVICCPFVDEETKRKLSVCKWTELIKRPKRTKYTCPSMSFQDVFLMKKF
jgi:hypothetical protein